MRRGVSFWLVAALVLGAAGAPTLARADEGSKQLEPYVPTGSRVPTKPEQVDPKLMRRMSKDLAHCIYRRHADRTSAFLHKTDPRTALAVDVLGLTNEELDHELSLSDCLGEAMTYDQRQTLLHVDEVRLRGLLSEEAYLGDHDTPLTIQEGEQEVLSTRFVDPAKKQDRSKVLAAFSDCITYHAPTQADALLRTAPASDKEMDAVRAMVPALSSCIEEGQEIELTAASIRLLAAEGLWARSAYGNKVKSAQSAEAALAAEHQAEGS